MRRLFASTFCLCLMACAVAPPPVAERVTVAPGITLELPAPGDLGRSVEAGRW